MNRSTPPSASRGSEDSSVLRKINPTLYQQLSQMNYPLPVDVESHMQTLITLGESMVRLSSRQAPEQEDDSESGGVTPKTFPEILKEILSDPDNKAAIRWLPHGKSFLVLDRKKFVQMVLPKYLGKATKYTSFTRKLTRWNFWRMPSGPDEGAWLNESFFRDRDGVKLRGMKCAKRKKSHAAKAFPRSRPLKKRPVDASLFVKDAKPNEATQRSVIGGLPACTNVKDPKPNESTQKSVLGGLPAYSCGGRPLALADTRSVVQAAMQALMQSQQAVAPDVTGLLRSSNTMYPYLNSRSTMTANILSGLQATPKGANA